MKILTVNSSTGIRAWAWLSRHVLGPQISVPRTCFRVLRFYKSPALVGWAPKGVKSYRFDKFLTARNISFRIFCFMPEFILTLPT